MTQQIEEIWSTLLRAGVVHGEAPKIGKPASPWYVKMVLAFSGWLAAIFLLFFLGLGFDFIFKNNLATLILGVIMIAGAFALFHLFKNDFGEHLALAVSFAGQVVVAYAIFDIYNQNGKIAWPLTLLLQITLTVVMPNFVHRVISSSIAAFAFFMVLTIMGWTYFSSAVLMFFAAMCWLYEFRYPRHMKMIRAIGYGLVLALIYLKGTVFFGHRILEWRIARYQPSIWAKPWMDEVLIGMVTFFVVRQLLRRYDQNLSAGLSTTVLLGTMVLCVASMKVQGITLGMVIMLLGFSGANRVLLGLGIMSLLFYISSYYYFLDATLLYKSQTLLLVGIILLGARWVMLRARPGKGEAPNV